MALRAPQHSEVRRPIAALQNVLEVADTSVDRKKEISQRVLTGVVGGLYLLIVLFFRGWFLSINLIFVALVAVSEMVSALRKAGVRPVIWPCVAFAIVSIPLWFWRTEVGILLALGVGVMAALASCLWRKQVQIADMMASALLVCYPILPLVMLNLLSSSDPVSITVVLITAVFVLSLGSDIFAFFVGTFLGKHKLCPNISPNKTIEGAIGSLVGTVLLAMAMGWLVETYWVHIAFYHYPILGLVGSLSAQLGDLVASAIKRACGIKDFGTIFPGHGGILDRLDGTLFTMVAITAYAVLVGLI